MKFYCFNITNFRVDGGAMFGVVPKLIWSRFIQADEDNLIPLALRSLVIETEGRIILVDNGIGDKQSKKFKSHLNMFGGQGMIGGLAEGGYAPEQITDVILTHLHFDHCGGGIEYDNRQNPYAVFPNAKYWVSQEQWDNAMNPNIREADAFLKENLLPMKDLGVLHFINGEQFLYPGVEIRLVHGHTPGQIIPIFHFNDRSLVYGADLFPSKAHVPVKYNMAYDLDVSKTMAEKEKFLLEFNTPKAAILFEHDIHNELGIIEDTIKGHRIGKTMSLETWINEL